MKFSIYEKKNKKRLHACQVSKVNGFIINKVDKKRGEVSNVRQKMASFFWDLLRMKRKRKNKGVAGSTLSCFYSNFVKGGEHSIPFPIFVFVLHGGQEIENAKSAGDHHVYLV